MELNSSNNKPTFPCWANSVLPTHLEDLTHFKSQLDAQVKLKQVIESPKEHTLNFVATRSGIGKTYIAQQIANSNAETLYIDLSRHDAKYTTELIQRTGCTKVIFDEPLLALESLSTILSFLSKNACTATFLIQDLCDVEVII